MTEDAEDLANAMAADMDRLIETSADVDPEDVLKTALKMSRASRGTSGERVLIGYSATTVISSEDFVAYRDEHLTPEVDKRRCPHPDGRMGVSVTIGTLTYTGEGDILGHHIEEEYRRDSDE